MKFALVGIGRWGQTYIRNLKSAENCELVATCSRTRESFNRLPDDLKGQTHYLSVLEMLKNEDFDTLIVATHPNTHYELSRDALWSRKNVICEKPFMLTNSQVAGIEELSAGRIFHTDYTNLHHQVINKMRHACDLSDTLPFVRLINVGCGPKREYSDIWDYGSHVGSVIYSLFPDEYFFMEDYHQDTSGNHSVKIRSSRACIEATFGSCADHRQHSFELSTGPRHVFWSNDGTENPLKIFLERFALGKEQTNIELSRKIQAFLTKIEGLNKSTNNKSQ